MNLTEALNQVLPEIPARMISRRYPRLHPAAVFKEHIQDGHPIVRVFIPGVEALFSFTPENWQFARLFDGQRTYEEVTDLYFQQTGIAYSVQQVRELADSLESIGFWYKTPLEKNVALMQKTAEERRKFFKQKKKFGDLSLITFPAVNPDRFLDWLHARIGFVYTWWFTLITLGAFGFMCGLFIVHWSEVGRDTFQFYNFADKTLWDVAAFWLLATVLMAIHEIAHGLTCKHYGGHVSSMGFALIYLSPAFYTDTTEGMVTGDRNQRLMISVAGVWSELMVCAIATPLWWGTPPGTAVHEFAYTIILITGIGVVLINWNPLMKLDGYHMLCEILGIVDLKEASTIYVSSWVKKNVWRLPVEVPYVPKKQRLGFAVYAILSGIYSYTVLYVLASFVGNAFRHFNPEWSFIPELATAGLIFRSRIRTLVNFMKLVYLDKKDRVRAWFTPRRSLAVAAAVTLFLLLPFWHETADGRFLLEPAHRAMVRNLVPGVVTQIYADEGEMVSAGAPLMQLRNLSLESRLARSQADAQVATGRAATALLRYTDLGPAYQERDRLTRQTQQLTAEAATLELQSPISGVVLTPRVRDDLGGYYPEGAELVEVADLDQLRARVYLSEHDMHKLRPNSYARLEVDGRFGLRKVDVAGIAPASEQIPPGLIDLTKYKGLRPPTFYVADLMIANRDHALKPGMVGTARLYGKRSSLALLAYRNVADFLGRKLW
ncbi:MAG TPA: HlyD family efflux transporter periplasmic adaptor subunit [Candidatus Sulfotelmatobacter sp.]|nr:HlyD family efflux transporter periplasmic adaptor subunit [Candidatus Sulfotelmatobacter sp.]